jgi:uncharacterized protein YbbC (DUF1343 family)/CubicO group peptidase (beta-lactamase class C family)
VNFRPQKFSGSIVSLVLTLAIAPFFPATPACGEPFDAAKLQQMDNSIEQAIADKRTPGAVIWVEHGTNTYTKAFGHRALVPALETMTRDTIFDAASLTKVIATTPAIMILVERGKIRLDQPVHDFIPEFQGSDRDRITVRQLMTHTSGLPPDVSTQPKWQGYDTAIRMACEIKLAAPPGEVFRYSDINFFLLGDIVRRASGMPLNEFCAKDVFAPLKMIDTGFLPPESKRSRIAPTEMTDGVMLRGVVHDPTARFMGGVAGHAGLFTTAADLARYARMMLNLGELDGVRILKADTVKLMTTVQTPPDMRNRRGLGWDIDSAFSRPRGTRFPRGSYGHTGFTGNAFWIDPFSKTFFVFLSNRVHPDGKGDVLPLYGTMGTLTAEAVTDFNFDSVPGALSRFGPRENEGQNAPDGPQVLNGIDVLVKNNFAPLKGLRIGLITNPTGIDRHRNPTIDLLRNAPGVQLKVLFSPEHGLYGTFDSSVVDGKDEHTGLPVYSLYGERHAPAPEQLKDLDALVFDIQDVGCRFYTYTTTLGLSMEAASNAHLKFFVLDRVNPINGVMIDGPVLDGPSTFVGYHTVPVRYGMTEGELAQMYKAENHFDSLDLTVVPLEGWKRAMWFDETGQPWLNPSPNMRSLAEAALYPGVGLLETCKISVGRGTGTPFEVIGAPYIDDIKLAGALNSLSIPGARFVPVRFTPTSYIFQNQSCGGVNIVLTDRERCNVVDIGIAAATILNRWYPEQFNLAGMSRLLVSPPTLEAIKAGKSLSEIRELWSAKTDEFKSRRDKFLIYR